jgi:iron-sulfur cluster repair protein YtfE (RIC family)
MAEDKSPPPVVPTPDDGHRLTGELDWQEHRRPQPDQLLTDAELTDEQLAAPRHLIDVHNGLRQELRQLRDIAARVLTEDLEIAAARSAINQLTMRQNNWTLGAYCASYCRIVAGHHGLEDAGIFPHLRRSDPSLDPVIDRLTEEHEVISEVLESVDRGLVALVDGRHGSRDQLQHAVDLLTDSLLSHLAWEERILLRPLAQYSFY